MERNNDQSGRNHKLKKKTARPTAIVIKVPGALSRKKTSRRRVGIEKARVKQVHCTSCVLSLQATGVAFRLSMLESTSLDVLRGATAS